MSKHAQQPSQTFAPYEAATLIGVSVHSVRRWVEYHAAYLDSRANPAPGVQRRLTQRDIEVLKHIKALREDGLSIALINEKLAGLTFAEIDTNSSTDAQELAVPANQASPDLAQIVLGYIDGQKGMQAQIDALQRSRQPSTFTALGIGFLAACFLFLLLIGLAILYGGFR